MKEIKLSQGKVALVDDEDYERLNKYYWHASSYSGKVFYARRVVGSGSVYMHNEILPSPLGMEIDHKDVDGLNNQKSNLRICTRSQNMANKSAHKGSVSRYKGVYRNKQRGKWQAQIRVRGQAKHLGLFQVEKDAALAYNLAAIKYFGEFAKPNILEAGVD